MQRFLSAIAMAFGAASVVGYGVVLVEFRLFGIYAGIMGAMLALGALVVWSSITAKKKKKLAVAVARTRD